MAEQASHPLDLTLIIPTLNEAGNIGELVRRARGVLDPLGIQYEILAIDGGSTDGTREEAEEAGARAILDKGTGYGDALRSGFQAASGEYLVTMDSDLSHAPEFIETMWARREQSDIIIASRYIRGGEYEMSWFRAVLSRILNVTYTTILRVPVKDISSGYRLYRRSAIEAINCRARDFDVLEEILIRLYVKGYKVDEVPFHYQPRKEGKSHAKLFRFAWAYLITLCHMMRLRWGRQS